MDPVKPMQKTINSESAVLKKLLLVFRKDGGGVASSSAEFPLLSLDGYSSGDDESSDPSSGNDKPMTRGRDRLESAELKGPFDMQSAPSDSHISSPSPTAETAYKISGSSGCDVCSNPVPGIGESKTRGRVRRKKAKKGARPRPRPPLKSLKSVKRPINRLRGRRKIMAAQVRTQQVLSG